MPAVSRWKLLLVALVASTAACGSDSPFTPEPPQEPLVVTVSAPATISADRSGGSYSCVIPFQAVANGGPTGSYAVWQDAEIVINRARDGQQLSRLGLGAAYAVEAPPRGWGNARIQSGQTLTMQLEISAPDAVVYTFRPSFQLSTTGASETVTTSTRCE